MKLKNIHKILFITLSNVGDVILTLPVLSALKDSFPSARIDVVVGPRPEKIFSKDPALNRVFTYDKHAALKEKLDFIKELRRERYDLAIDMRTSLIPVLIGARNTSSLVSAARGRDRHKRSVHLNKLKNLGIEYKARKDIYIDDKDRIAVQGLLEENNVKKGDRLIGISPACRGPLKQWRTEGFIDVINAILKHKDCKVILMGDSSEASVSKRIKDAVNHNGLIDLTGRTDLNELFALIERLEILLTGDSACMHIASDLGVKVAAIFGPTDPEEYGPTGKDDIVIRKKLKCAPCKKAMCRFDHECMKEITARDVLSAINKLTL
ncbi:MAG: glycosyltransferase family 9 protein [Candidatus Omnitrophica bacterium]|nr:glycosyltransferase family 9 protein [Candidatus Omnitrophota bacterium]